MTKKIDKAEISEEEKTEAADTLNPNSMPAEGSPKTAKMAAAMNMMSQMDGDTINKFMEVLAQFDTVYKADVIPNDAAEKNMASIAAKGAMKEDVADLFSTENLSEEFKEKATTILEAAVNLKVAERIAQLEESYEAKLSEEIEEANTFVVENLNKYLDYVVSEWMKENEVAIVSSLKSEMTEQFIHGLKNLFLEHYVEMPEEKLDVFSEMNSKLEDLEKKLSEQMEENIELKNIIEQNEAEKIFESISSGLATSQVEKLKTLAEGVEYTSLDDLKSKLEVIKESFLSNGSSNKNAKTMLFEEIDEDYEVPADTNVKVSGVMAKYVNTISKTVKNR